MDLIQAVGLLGGGLSTVLALMKLREYIRQTPRFDVAAFAGENTDHLDVIIRVVKRGSAAAYLTVVGFAWRPGRPGPGGRAYDPTSGSALRDMGETLALRYNEHQPTLLELVSRRLRRPQPMNGVAIQDEGAVLPRLMQIEGDLIDLKRCASRLAGMARLYGGPPTFVVAVDSVGRYSWAPISEGVRLGILQAAMDDGSDPGSLRPCTALGGGLYASGSRGLRPILLEDLPTFFRF